MIRSFRFGVVGTPFGGGDAWRALAARVSELGYSCLLMPDGLQLLAPFPALATAAAVADIRVGTFVLAAPLRPPASAAWEAHSMTVLTGGRFEFGIGTGRPGVEDFSRRLGLPYGTGADRLAQVRAAIDAVRELDGGATPTPVLIAAGGPKARALAAEKADILTLATGALISRDETAAMVADVRARAGARADDIEIASNLFVVGEDIPAHVESHIGTDAATLRATDSLAMLRGTVPEMADELQRRRDQIGSSYVTVNAEYMRQLAPVVERLAGR